MTTTTTTAPPTTTTTTDPEVAAWQQTAICEESGADDPTYGYYGIHPDSWLAYGGAQYAPVAGEATQSEQVAIGMAIEGRPPDVGGCRGSW